MRVCFADVDGVVHPADVRLHEHRIPMFGPGLDGHHLFEHARLLADLLAPHQDVRIILSTSWVQVFGYAQTMGMFPQVLQSRVIGSCFDPERHGPAYGQVARGYQVLEEVRRLDLKTWVALDDDVKDWPEEASAHLIATHPVLGLSAPEPRQALERWLSDSQPRH